MSPAVIEDITTKARASSLPTRVRTMIAPSETAESGGPSLGQVPEIYDADDSPQRPRRPDGCFAQAWSVAECLRVLAMTMKK